MTQAKSTTKHAADAPAPARTAGDLADIQLARLTATVAQAMAAIAEIRAALPNAARLTARHLRHTADLGVDPSVYGSARLKKRLQRVDAPAPLSDALEGLAQDIGDTVLELGELGCEPLLAAYAILKSVVRTDATLKELLKESIDSYAALAQAAAETRRAKNAELVSSSKRECPQIDRP